MSDAYTGEIRLFAGPYAPRGWHYCDGTALPISGNEALYSLIGVTYGGDGRNTFCLPDLRGRVAVGQGQGTGLTSRPLGQKGGTSTVTLTVAQIPSHGHTFSASKKTATSTTPSSGGGLGATTGGTVVSYATPALATSDQQVATSTAAISYSNGGNGPHTNLMPYLAVNHIICLNGFYPEFS